jgi:hypothetical protein
MITIKLITYFQHFRTSKKYENTELVADLCNILSLLFKSYGLYSLSKRNGTGKSRCDTWPALIQNRFKIEI